MKRALHAPVNRTWSECSYIDVFPNGDANLLPAFTVLHDAIEKSTRSAIIHGLIGYISIAEGARVLIAEMGVIASTASPQG